MGAVVVEVIAAQAHRGRSRDITGSDNRPRDGGERPEQRLHLIVVQCVECRQCKQVVVSSIRRLRSRPAAVIKPSPSNRPRRASRSEKKLHCSSS